MTNAQKAIQATIDAIIAARDHNGVTLNAVSASQEVIDSLTQLAELTSVLKIENINKVLEQKKQELCCHPEFFNVGFPVLTHEDTTEAQYEDTFAAGMRAAIETVSAVIMSGISAQRNLGQSPAQGSEALDVLWELSCIAKKNPNATSQDLAAQCKDFVDCKTDLESSCVIKMAGESHSQTSKKGVELWGDKVQKFHDLFNDLPKGTAIAIEGAIDNNGVSYKTTSTRLYLPAMRLDLQVIDHDNWFATPIHRAPTVFFQENVSIPFIGVTSVEKDGEQIVVKTANATYRIETILPVQANALDQNLFGAPLRFGHGAEKSSNRFSANGSF